MSFSVENEVCTCETFQTFVAKKYDICPGNVELFEQYYPTVDWRQMLVFIPDLIGKTFTKPRLEKVISYHTEYTRFEEVVAECIAREKVVEDRLDELRRIAARQTTTITSMFARMRVVAQEANRTEEELDEKEAESDDETDWHPTRDPEIAEYYLTSRKISKLMNEAEANQDLFDVVKAELDKLQDERPPLPHFMTLLPNEYMTESEREDAWWQHQKDIAALKARKPNYEIRDLFFDSELSEDEEEEKTGGAKAQKNKKKSKKNKNKKKGKK